jgi:ABC-type lipoprotein export system ATPase subunit
MAQESDNGRNGHVIETRELWRVYRAGAQDVQALRGVDLQIDSASFVALKGRSGGLDRPTSGEIHVFGRNLSELSEDQLTQWRREKVGFVFQAFGLLPTLSAFENVELMARIAGLPRRERRERTLYCLELVGLANRAQHRPYEMSGGQQQRVGIARALVNTPQLILADEPTGELDSTTAREILFLFRQIADDEGMTLLVASHDALVDEYVDRVLQLQDGQITQITSTVPQ